MEARKCKSCGADICEDRAKYFNPPFCDLCNECRKKAIMKKNYGVNLKDMVKK